ncbi:MAG: hypothetical protein HWE27_08995 [Gammaproteobacteria bacterium]|nr:hypothetical protein [Gammaproteobacteria bacterium]
MLLQASQLFHLQPFDKVVIHSIDISLYQASVEVAGEQFYIADNKGKLIRAFNIIELQKLFRGFKYKQMVLRHESAYDEMIGLTNKKTHQNFMEVPLKDNYLD